MLTSGSESQVAARLTNLVAPHAWIDPGDKWMPRGFLNPAEAKLVPPEQLMASDHCNALADWWLAESQGANRPNWDIASTAEIEGRRGLVLVEAKAHSTELSSGGKSAIGASEASRANDSRIRAAIRQASDSLGGDQAGWHLSADAHYQLSNRFAWSWKIAALGMPVVLVYLGFLNAEDMADQGIPFSSADQWEDVVWQHADQIVPRSAWNEPIDVFGTPMRAMIRPCEIKWSFGRSRP